MVQFYQPPERKPSFGAQLSQGFGNALNTGAQLVGQYQQKNSQKEAFKKFGIDPSAANLPEEAQKAYFKNKFTSPEELNPLQKSQLQLNEEKIKASQQQQGFWEGIMGGKEIPPENATERGSDTSIQSSLSTLSDEKLKKLAAFAGQPGNAGIVGSYAKNELDRKAHQSKEERQKFEADREFHTKRSGPVISEAASIMKNSPINKGLIDQQRRDIASGNTEGLLPFLVDKLGLESYRNPESTRFLTASKQRFVESLHDLGGAGARPNQFIEQQLTRAQPQLGRSAEANQTVLDLEEFVNDLKEKRAQTILDLAEQDYNEFGYEKSDIERRADKVMKDYSEQRQEQLANTIRNRHEENLSDEQLVKEVVSGQIPRDTPLTLRMARILMIKNNDDPIAAEKEAKKLGFRIPKE